MEVDAAAALDGFLSRQPDVRKRSQDALQRWERADPGALAKFLAAHVAAMPMLAESVGCSHSSRSPAPVAEQLDADEILSAGISLADNSKENARVLAAVLLRKVLVRNGNALLGLAEQAGGARLPPLQKCLLDALSASLPEEPVCKSAADAVVVAASAIFASGEAWPEFAVLLAQWCEGGKAARAVVLHILEQLRDEAEDVSEDEAADSPRHGKADTTVDGDASTDLEEAESCGNAASKRRCPEESLCALLAFLEDHGGALHTLLTTALREETDGHVREAAARMYAYCASDSRVPEVLRTSVRDIAAVLAEVLVENVDTTGAWREACYQAVALAARADPTAWCSGNAGSAAALSSLPASLAASGVDATASPELRSAALAALLELLTAADLQAAADGNSMDEAVQELVAHAVATVAALFAELPDDEDTNMWAETADDGDGCDALPEKSTEGTEALLESALDAAERLACRGGEAVAGLRVAAGELLGRQAWQGQHGALLILLRVACASPEHDSISLLETLRAALRSFSHVHPRVRWAALEVWVRLLVVSQSFPEQLFAEAFEGLMLLAGTSEQYLRVRRRALLVLVVAASRPMPLYCTAHAEPLFECVLLPCARAQDISLREAACHIAEGLIASLGGGGAEASPPEEILAMVAPTSTCLWEQFREALAQCEQASSKGDILVTDGQVEWPAHWR
eukprot:TRINITY_DN3314_c0_g2_i1.p1 TRINITY_DN3314_c0_g2~~TRINITY_DN3314_c0_g2_i1.p1  ORF type:complete len:691 (-),score=153.98 TRINITY_DN3314_c0_g2_i1:23-2095(-)